MQIDLERQHRIWGLRPYAAEHIAGQRGQQQHHQHADEKPVVDRHMQRQLEHEVAEIAPELRIVTPPLLAIRPQHVVLPMRIGLQREQQAADQRDGNHDRPEIGFGRAPPAVHAPLVCGNDPVDPGQLVRQQHVARDHCRHEQERHHPHPDLGFHDGQIDIEIADIVEPQDLGVKTGGENDREQESGQPHDPVEQRAGHTAEEEERRRADLGGRA